MSRKTVEIVRRGIQAWNLGDIDGVVEMLSPECTLTPFAEWPGEPIYRGREGWRRLIGEWIDNFDDITWEVERLAEADDHVIALVTHRGRIKGTEVPIAQPLGAVFSDFGPDDTIGAAQFYMSWAEAGEAIEDS